MKTRLVFTVVLENLPWWESKMTNYGCWWWPLSRRREVPLFRFTCCSLTAKYFGLSDYFTFPWHCYYYLWCNEFTGFIIHKLSIPSVLRHIFTSFGYNMISLTLGKVYGGYKINTQSLYCFNPHMSFWGYIKSTNNKQNKYEDKSQYWRGFKDNTSIIYLFIFYAKGNLKKGNKNYYIKRSRWFFLCILLCSLPSFSYPQKRKEKKSVMDEKCSPVQYPIDKL